MASLCKLYRFEELSLMYPDDGYNYYLFTLDGDASWIGIDKVSLPTIINNKALINIQSDKYNIHTIIYKDCHPACAVIGAKFDVLSQSDIKEYKFVDIKSGDVRRIYYNIFHEIINIPDTTLYNFISFVQIKDVFDVHTDNIVIRSKSSLIELYNIIIKYYNKSAAYSKNFAYWILTDEDIKKCKESKCKKCKKCKKSKCDKDSLDTSGNKKDENVEVKENENVEVKENENVEVKEDENENVNDEEIDDENDSSDKSKNNDSSDTSRNDEYKIYKIEIINGSHDN